MTPTGTQRVWDALRRPLDPVPALDALFGLSHSSARQLVGTVLATSDEAETLLDGLPQVVRSLAVATSITAMRCVGEVRGAVLWSETLAARSASPGAQEVFICASASKAFDTAENQVLVRALTIVRDSAAHSDDPHARHNGGRAIRFLDHRTLAGVGRTKMDGRRLRRARAGTRRHTYEPAVAMIERSAEPLAYAHLAPLVDEATAADHDELARLATVLALPRWVVSHGALVGGSVRYRHGEGIEVSGRAWQTPAP